MLIGLHDAEAEYFYQRRNRKKKTFPNLALMKISAWHKSRGDTVEWWTPIKNDFYDCVYSSKVFSFTPENLSLPLKTIRGGTGYDIKTELAPEIDAMFPDYSIYPDCDYAVGLITRGCVRNCPWCVVPQKEGGIKPYRRWRDIVRADTNKLVLMDNNILACEFGVSELDSLIGSGYSVDVNQGLDARLVDAPIADILSKLKWIEHIRFSCDTENQTAAVINAANLLAERGIKPYRLFVYLLVTADTDEAARRVEKLKQLKGVTIYAQAERSFDAIAPPPTAAQLEFAQRYIYSGAFRKETWREYCENRRFNFQ